MEFEWDPRKAAANRKKHGVDFADAVAVFSDEIALTMPDDSSDEERFVTLGCDTLNRVLVVVYTWRGERIRMVSARKATRRERAEHEGGKR